MTYVYPKMIGKCLFCMLKGRLIRFYVLPLQEAGNVYLTHAGRVSINGGSDLILNVLVLPPIFLKGTPPNPPNVLLGGDFIRLT